MEASVGTVFLSSGQFRSAALPVLVQFFFQMHSLDPGMTATIRNTLFDLVVLNVRCQRAVLPSGALPQRWSRGPAAAYEMTHADAAFEDILQGCVDFYAL